MTTEKPRPVFDFEAMEYHKGTADLTKYLATRANSKDYHFIRVITAFYLGLVATTMRNSLLLPGNRPVPLNVFAMGLLPSGQGKGVLTGEFENVILQPLTSTFHKEWIDLREKLIFDECNRLATLNSSEPAEEEKAVRKSIESLGSPYLYFEESTSPAFKQCRSALLRVPMGSLNFIVDEYFAVDGSNAEVMQDMIKTYDIGQLKQKLIKHSADTPRYVDDTGCVPTNMLLFGTGSQLENPMVHADLLRNLEGGLARRTLFAFSRDIDRSIITPEERLKNLTATSDPTTIKGYTNTIARMIHPKNHFKVFHMNDDVALYMLEYQHYCEVRATKVKDKVLKAELIHRYMKVSKIAGLYAAWDGTHEITMEQLQASIKLAEENEEHIARIVYTVPIHARLAEYLASQESEMTMAQLVAQLPWFKGSAQSREQMLQLACEHGYSNSIIINKEVRNGITFIKGEGITPTDLSALRFAISTDMTYNYKNGICKWDQLGKILTKEGTHWTTHWLDAGHRQSQNVQAGFNLIVLDVDNGPTTSTNVPMQTAKTLLKDYQFIMYESKSSTPQYNRYRIIFPTTHVLKLSEEVFAKFMSNIYDWLPITFDEVTNQRSRKWLGYSGTPHYNTGKLFPVLDFIPETEAAIKVQKQTVAMGDLSHIERWIVREIHKGSPRNNTLLRYALMLVDAGLPQQSVEKAVALLNQKLATPLPTSEITSTIFVTVAKRIANKP